MMIEKVTQSPLKQASKGCKHGRNRLKAQDCLSGKTSVRVEADPGGPTVSLRSGADIFWEWPAGASCARGWLWLNIGSKEATHMGNVQLDSLLCFCPHPTLSSWALLRALWESKSQNRSRSPPTVRRYGSLPGLNPCKSSFGHFRKNVQVLKVRDSQAKKREKIVAGIERRQMFTVFQASNWKSKNNSTN